MPPLPVGRSAPRTWDRWWRAVLVWAGRSKGWNSAASAGLLATAVAEAGAGALRRCAATVAGVARRLCCCGACAVSSGQQSLDGTGHHGPRAASPGVECRRATRAGTESGHLRHRHPHTSPDGKRRRGCCERRCGKGGCLAGPASDAGQRNCVGAAGVVGTQKAATAATSLHRLLLCFCLWGGLRRPVAAVAGVASVPCASVLAKSEEPPPRTRGRERTTSGAATQRPRHQPQRQLPRPPPFQRASAVEARQPERPCPFASRTLRLRAPSRPAAGRSAADAPGPPKHLG